DPDIEPSEATERTQAELLDLLAVADVGRYDERLHAELLALAPQLRQQLRATSREHQMGLRPRQLQGRALAEAARGARDHHHLALEVMLRHDVLLRLLTVCLSNWRRTRRFQGARDRIRDARPPTPRFSRSRARRRSAGNRAERASTSG